MRHIDSPMIITIKVGVRINEETNPLLKWGNISNLDQPVQLPKTPNDGHPGGNRKDKRQFREKKERETPQGSGDSPEGGRDNFISRTSLCLTRTLRASHFPQTCDLELGEESLIGEGELATSLKEWVDSPCSCFFNIRIFNILGSKSSNDFSYEMNSALR